ncbi:MAG: hypothetical protein JW709_11625 [Sedimentisphaerales bacterium]|nr:hypothetical protein [Sedimentisphaerales bacterium]
MLDAFLNVFTDDGSKIVDMLIIDKFADAGRNRLDLVVRRENVDLLAL